MTERTVEELLAVIEQQKAGNRALVNRVQRLKRQNAELQKRDPVEKLLRRLEQPRNGWRLLWISHQPGLHGEEGRSVTLTDEHCDIKFNGPTLRSALEQALAARWRHGQATTQGEPT